MITAFAELATASLNLANTVEQNMNRPDMVAAAVAKTRQKYRDAVDAAQAVIADPKSSQADQQHAFAFIQRIES
jgi:hypothetical protein